MRWEKLKVPLLELGLIVTGVVAVISLISVFVLKARLTNAEAGQEIVQENTAAQYRQTLEKQLMVYGSADDKALVMRDALAMQGLASDTLVVNAQDDVVAARDVDGHVYVWRISDRELLGTYANTSYDSALLIGQNRILLGERGTFYCSDYTSGMQLWKWQFPCEDCLWQYDSERELLYILSEMPDRDFENASANASNGSDENDEDRGSYGDGDSSNTGQVKHDLYVLSLDGLTVNYVRPVDLISEENSYASSRICELALSEDRTMLLVNGYLSDTFDTARRYFSKVYEVGTLDFSEDFADAGSYDEDEAAHSNADSAVNPMQAPSAEIVKAQESIYSEHGDSGWRMTTKWIDNESLLQYSEELIRPDEGEEQSGDAWDEEDEDADFTGGDVTVPEETDELDEEPETVEWSVRKKTLSYGSTMWKIAGNGKPTDDVRLERYAVDENVRLILVLSQCAVTLEADSGREAGRMIDTADFIYIEPKGERPAMFITKDGSVIQGKRHYSLGLAEIRAVSQSADTYFVAAENSIFLYTMAGNIAESGTRLAGSDENPWSTATFSEDGSYVALSGQRFLGYYETATGNRLYQNVCQTSIGPDVVICGNRLGHIDASGRNFMVYDPETGQRIQIPLAGAAIREIPQIRTVGDGYVMIASGTGQRLWIVDLREQVITKTISAKELIEAAGLDYDSSILEYCRMTPDAEHLLFSVRTSDAAGALTLEAFMMDMETGEATLCDSLAAWLDVPSEELASLQCASDTFSRDGKYALFVGPNHAVGIFAIDEVRFAREVQCGELDAAPIITPDGIVVCVTHGGDLVAFLADSGRFIGVDEENRAVTTDDLFVLDRPGTGIRLTFDVTGTKLCAGGVRNGKTFVRVYSVGDGGVLTPETEIPQALACNDARVLMRYGDAEAELFPYLSLSELEERANAASTAAP